LERYPFLHGKNPLRSREACLEASLPPVFIGVSSRFWQLPTVPSSNPIVFF
jgi:hypothetical protein